MTFYFCLTKHVSQRHVREKKSRKMNLKAEIYEYDLDMTLRSSDVRDRLELCFIILKKDIILRYYTREKHK